MLYISVALLVSAFEHICMIICLCTGVTSKDRIDDEIVSLYVTLPFRSEIAQVDLLSGTVTTLKTCDDDAINQPWKEKGSRCCRPSYLAVVSEDQLLVTNNQGIFGFNTKTNKIEIYTSSGGFTHDTYLDGEFGIAQVADVGPPIQLPGHDGVFIVADFLLQNLRVIDINARYISSLCHKVEFGDSRNPASSSLTDLPPCHLSNPYGLMFKKSSILEVVISHGWVISSFEMKCK